VGCDLDITLELSEHKWRPAADLPLLWEENKDALLALPLAAALGGECWAEFGLSGLAGEAGQGGGRVLSLCRQVLLAGRGVWDGRKMGADVASSQMLGKGKKGGSGGKGASFST
jgi:hypothetical protein